MPIEDVLGSACPLTIRYPVAVAAMSAPIPTKSGDDGTASVKSPSRANTVPSVRSTSLLSSINEIMNFFRSSSCICILSKSGHGLIVLTPFTNIFTAEYAKGAEFALLIDPPFLKVFALAKKGGRSNR